MGLASGPPGGRRAASTLDRATRTVCHMGRGGCQSGRREYPHGDVGQTQGRRPPSPTRSTPRRPCARPPDRHPSRHGHRRSAPVGGNTLVVGTAERGLRRGPGRSSSGSSSRTRPPTSPGLRWSGRWRPCSPVSCSASCSPARRPGCSAGPSAGARCPWPRPARRRPWPSSSYGAAAVSAGRVSRTRHPARRHAAAGRHRAGAAPTLTDRGVLLRGLQRLLGDLGIPAGRTALRLGIICDRAVLPGRRRRRDRGQGGGPTR